MVRELDHNKAINVIEAYLKDSDHGFGFEQRGELFGHSERSYGDWRKHDRPSCKTVSKRSWFFHRVFQEYLAAYYLSRIPLSEQLSIVEIHCADPQWHETILGLFYVTSRAEDIKQFIDRIKTKLKSVNTIDHYVIDLLLCETTFGDFNCPVGLARELAEKAFEQIELGSWMPQRERLLHHVLDGLRSTKVKELVKSKLKELVSFAEKDGEKEYLVQWQIGHLFQKLLSVYGKAYMMKNQIINGQQQGFWLIQQKVTGNW